MAEPGAAYKGRNSSPIRFDWKVFIWCFLIAAILWLLTALNEQYTSNAISVKVHYQNIPRDRVFVKPLPEEFKLSVNAKGWDLMSYYFKGMDVINIDLNDYAKQDVILSKRLAPTMQEQLSQKIVITDIYPESISLQKAPKIYKKVPVKLNMAVTYERQYNLGDEIHYTPDSITVSGPATAVNGINYVETELLKLKDINKPLNVPVKLKNPAAQNIYYSAKEVQVNIPLYQLTEQVTTIPVTIINSKLKYPIHLIPRKVTLTYQTSLNRFNQIDSTLFEAIVDGSKIDTSRRQLLKVDVISQPKFTYNLHIRPEYVDYIINK
jgi:YbbR domain-containing protein